jgi:hypothetical protein
MGYLIRMAPEVAHWLAVVRGRDPALADLIDEAVGALRAGGERVGPPLVIPLDDPSRSVRPDLDAAYERQLGMLTRVRRAIADVATSRKRWNWRPDTWNRWSPRPESRALVSSITVPSPGQPAARGCVS